MIVGLPMMKQSAEQWAWSVDFTDVLEEGSPAEQISAVSFTAFDPDGEDVTNDLQAGLPAISGPLVAVELQGGEHNVDYTLQFRVTTDRGHVWDAERVLAVRDVPEPV